MKHRFRLPSTATPLGAALALGLSASAFAGDGRPEFPLSIADARERAEARFQSMDTDGSGEISPDELAAARSEAGHRHRGHAFRYRLEHFRGSDGEGQSGDREAGREARRQGRADIDAEVFERLDTNGDGLLSRDEYTPTRRREASHAAMQARVFERLDADDSGGLSRAELPDRTRWLEAMDKDGDGIVTEAEAREHRHRDKQPS